MYATITSCKIGILNTEALLSIGDTNIYYAIETYYRLTRQLSDFRRQLDRLQRQGDPVEPTIMRRMESLNIRPIPLRRRLGRTN